MNKAILIGRLIKDPELRYTPGNGTAVCKFRLAINRIKKDEADFIPCVAFGKAAETISTYVKKGNQLAVEGRIQTSSYDSQDGSKRYSTDVIVESFEFIGNKKSGQDNANDFGGGFEDNTTPVDDGDMPF